MIMVTTPDLTRKVIPLVLALLLLTSCSKNASSDFTAVMLKCDNQDNPYGTGSTPRFNWIISFSTPGTLQTAYQIILDPDQDNLKSEKGCFWNSGKISSSETSWIPYSGPALKPGQLYFWKLRIWDNNDKSSPWSGTAYFLTGLFNPGDWDGAKWIGYEEIPDSLLLVPGVHGNGNNLGNVAKQRTIVPAFRREFKVEKKIVHALAFVSGAGHYELYINGKKIGDRFLSPGWTNYNKTCLYNTFDVTRNLKRGMNAIGVITGNGFYNINRERYRKLVIAWGAPSVILKLKIVYSDGSEEVVVSDRSWKTAPSPITFTSIYGGEDYDARLEQDGWDSPGSDDTKWKDALEVKGPAGELKPETDYPVKVMKVFDPAVINHINDSVFVYDYLQNASGIVKLTVSGRSGQEVRLIPGELLGDDSLVTQRATGDPYYFSYTLKGESEEIWMPRFSYYGFRYVQVEGAIPAGKSNSGNLPVIQKLQFLHTRNSSPSAGSFRCSNELFNSIYELINWSIKSNLASVTTDCPHREKLGWLEQTHLMGNSIKYIYDIHNLYDKIIDDMIEAQLENGLVPDIAPEYVPFEGGFRDSPEWGSACVILPWDMYEWYGDLNAVRKAFPMMKRYLTYLKGMSDDHILSHGLGDWYDLGPKFPGEAQLTPKALTATAIYFYDAKLLSAMAGLLGENEDAVYYGKLAEEIRIAFNDRFFDPVSKVYSTGSQTSYAMPLFFGIVDSVSRKDVAANLIKSVHESGKALTAGDVGYRYLLRALEEEGESQLIYEMNSRSDVPGYGFQLSKGATSLTESWAGLKDVSNNHMMLGHLMEWFFSGIGGIRQVPGSKAGEQIIISPEITGDITWAETSYHSLHGEILSSWKISGNVFSLKVRIPANCKATVVIPGSDPGKVTESGIPLNASGNVKVKAVTSGKTYCEVTPGEYLFEVSVLAYK